MSGPTVQVHRARDRFVTQTDGLTSRHAFSFGEHYDPENVGFGRLLVSNEDLVRAGHGYGEHPHRNAEILTWVLSGSLVHTDSAGNRGVVYPGLAARMSAGTGIVHSERNDAFRLDRERPETPVHFVQMWLRPDSDGAVPGYAQREVALADLTGGWVPIASGCHPDAAVDLGIRGSTLWATRLGSGQSRTLPEAPLSHLQVVAGEIEMEMVGAVSAGDTVRISGPAPLRLTGRAHAEILLWGMAP